MSTRCAVIIERNDDYGPTNGNTGYRSEAYYRHHDGHLTGTGFDLVRQLYRLAEHRDGVISTFCEASDAMKGVLTQYYQAIAVDHIPGDIEFLYVVNFNNGIFVRAYCRPRGSEHPDARDPYAWPSLEIFSMPAMLIRNTYRYVAHHVILALDPRELMLTAAPEGTA